ncbi:MAG: hypothetical protein ACW99F_00840 [Candidatus Hodarchaeales archaeon]|jgi:hypothetical protein
MSDFISKTIKNILSNGIALNLDSKEEEEYYMMKMFDFFSEETEFTSYLRQQNVLEIENSSMELAMEVIMSDSTLYMLPYSQDVFDIFTQVLRFISISHSDIIKDFRGIEETKIESITEVNQNDNEKPEETEEESDGDDDLEWI